MELLGYQPVASANANLMNSAYWGDSIIRMWIRHRIRHEFAGRGSGYSPGSTSHEDRLNSNEQMILFAHALFPECQGKRIADNFEAFISYMHDNNYAYEYLLEAYYQYYMLSLPRKKKVWSGVEMRCPLMNHLRKKNKL